MVINSLPASTSLKEEFDFLAPDRERAQDGTIGDAAHQAEPSDHNPDETGNTGGMEDADNIDEVHARDVDARGPWPAGWSMERCVQIVISRCRAGLEKRLNYVIYNRRIWAAGTSTPWAEREYTGGDPHDKHGHFSFKYGSGSGQSNPENITGPWGIRTARQKEIDDMELTPENLKAIADAVADRLKVPSGKGVMDKLGADLDNSDSGVAKGMRKQVSAVVDPPAGK